MNVIVILRARPWRLPVMQQLRDYLYLDLKRLEDYLSILEPTGEVRQLVETIHKERVEGEKSFGVPADEGGQPEITTERTISTSAKNGFNRLYEKLSDSIIDIDEDPREVKKGSTIEVTRHFQPSPVAQMIDSIPEVLRIITSSAEVELDDDVKERLVELRLDLLKDPRMQHDIPIIAKVLGPSYSVVFRAERQFILRSPAEMADDMTLVGKVRDVIPDNYELNLLTLPNVVSLSRIQQSGMQADDIVELLTDQAEEVGLELDSDTFTIKGPAIVVDALAAFT
jgi:hypothetical protein